MASKPPKEPRVTDMQRAYAAAYLEHGDKKRAAREAGFKGWKTNFPAIHKQRGVQYAMMQMAKDARAHPEITGDYLMATMHEIVERSMQTKPVKDSRGKPVLTEIEMDDGTIQVAQLVTFDGRTALQAAKTMGEAIGMFRPPEKEDTSKADAEKEQRERSVLAELKRIGDAVERKPHIQSAPIVGLDDEKPTSPKPRVN